MYVCVCVCAEWVVLVVTDCMYVCVYVYVYPPLTLLSPFIPLYPPCYLFFLLLIYPLLNPSFHLPTSSLIPRRRRRYGSASYLLDYFNGKVAEARTDINNNSNISCSNNSSSTSQNMNLKFYDVPTLYWTMYWKT